jgi:hypothetical protein
LVVGDEQADLLCVGILVEQKLDAGVQETFPASDAVSITPPSETAYEAAQRRKRSS